MLGYFTEIEILQNKIKQLENKLEQERIEHREAYQRMKQLTVIYEDEIMHLKQENVKLNTKLEEVSYEELENKKND